MKRILLLLLAVIGTVVRPNTAAAQVNALAAKSPEATSAVQLAIPGGATAAVNPASGGTAGPTMGFQAWSESTGTATPSWFLGSFFTFAAPTTVKGTQSDFGMSVLNPESAGTSFYVAGNWTHTPKLGKWSTGACLIGFAGRAGITNTTWEASLGGTDQTLTGFTGYISAAFLITTPLFRAKSSDATSAPNEYQFGFQVGPTWRTIGGDLSQHEDFVSDSKVLGHEVRHLRGVEMTLFLRLNSFQPFVRFTHFGQLSTSGSSTTSPIDGLTGWQTFFGVNVLSAIFQTGGS